MKNLLLLILLFFQINLIFGQTKSKVFELDSLKQEFTKVKNDTDRVLLYEKMIRVAPNSQAGIEYGFNGFNLAKRIRYDKGVILCGNSVGFKLVESDYYKAVQILTEVKQTCERQNNQYELARTLGFLGYAYNKFDFEKAMSYFKACKKMMEKVKMSEDIIPINSAIGNCYKDFGKLDSALVYIQKGYEHSLKSDKLLPPYSFYVHFGEVYLKKGQFKLAMDYFRRSIAAKPNNPDGQAYQGIAMIYRAKNQLDSAKFYAKESLSIQQKKNKPIYIIQSANLLFELYKNSNPAEALKYILISSATKDSLFNQEKVKQVEKLAYEERESEARLQRRLEAHEADLQSKIRIYALSGILLALVVLSLILYRNNKSKQKANHLLHKQKEEIDLQREKAENALVELKSTQNQLIQAEKMASLGELTAGIAHEIQNPLNFVNNFSEMSVELAHELNEEIDKDTMDKNLVKEILSDLTQNQQKINHHGKRASSIVKGMLEHSRTSTGVKELTDINALADEYLRLAYHGLRAKDNSFNCDFKTEFDESLPKIEVIPQDFGRVLLNLINNAFYAVSQRKNLQGLADLTGLGTVIVSTKKLDNFIEIRVTDNGIGMSEATRAKIFQPFFTTKPTGQGTGLGLSLAYDIITKGHEGTIEVESKEGEGSEFIITLPMKPN
ncbi:ATP-binding protein [Emticicia sp. SJ17W-69]|uniref:ATP-binding protein n=1 Tax=Emticicia sp. SJ17W-69 TaxID=3421657 RepID=UPI003EBEBE9C